MAYKQRSNGLPFKQMGSSPAKHYVDDNREHNTPEHSDDLQTPEEHKTGKVESPAKQLKEEYMRTPQEKAFYESSESKDFEPEPSGTYRGIGSYSKNKKTGDVVSKGIAGSKPKKKVATSEKVGPVESPKALAEKKALARETKVGPSGTEFDASDADYETDKEERTASREAQKYVKKK